MTTREEDFLENDTSIRGQNYALLSFISPESILKDKHSFFIEKFLRHLAPDVKLKAEDIHSKYLDFLYTREENLTSEFNKNNDFQTSVRGVKVRGVYDSLKEAQVKAKRLQNTDKNFHVFVGQVGFWLPWDPNADYCDNQEYKNQELNTLMKEYKENSEHKDILYEELKNEKITKTKEDNERIIKENEKQEAENKNLEPEPMTEPEPEPMTEPEPEQVADSSLFDTDDPWLVHKQNNK